MIILRVFEFHSFFGATFGFLTEGLPVPGTTEIDSVYVPAANREGKRARAVHGRTEADRHDDSTDMATNRQ